MPLSVAILAQTSLARESRTVAAMPRMPQKQLSLPASSVAAPAPAPAMAAPMEQSPRRPVEVAKPKPMTNLQVVKRIALQNNVTMHVVRLVLNTIVSKTKEELITKGKSKLWAFVPFVSMKVVEKPPIMDYQKRYRTGRKSGRIENVKARPRRKKVKAYVHPKLEILLARGLPSC